MSRGGRSPAAMLLALVGVVALGVAGSMSSIVQLSAVVTALVMGGNTNPDPSTEYVDSQIDNYYDASFTGVRRGIHTPEEFWPNNGTLTFDQSTAEGVDDLEHEMDTTDGELVIVGYSASTRIASAEKYKLIAEGDYSRDITFVLISDVNKGNGGILARFGGWTIPILGVTFDGATRTDSENGQFETKSITFVHDGWSDFPIYPANVLADANAVAGIALLHGTYPNLDNPTLTPVGSTGDTDYYVIETDIVPLLMPLESAGVPRAVLLGMWGPVTRKVAVTDIWHPPCLRDRLPCNGFRSGGLNALPKCVKSRAKELPQTMAYYLR
ncbi:PE-PPE domain-containing protein [Mycolicibacterium mageritense]